MKVSEIKPENLYLHLRIDPFYVTDEEGEHIQILKKAAIEYVKSYTGLAEEELDENEDITIAILVLVTDMYDNRQMTVDRNQVNRVVDTILGMHCVNLL